MPTRTASSHAHLHVRRAERHEGHDVGGADARVDSAVDVQVDQRRGARDSAEGGFSHWTRSAGNGQHHAVVHRVSVAVQNPRAVHLRRGRLDGGHDIRTRAFTEIRDALDQRARRSVLCATYHAGTALNHSDSSSIFDLTLGEFLERLGSSDPTPGGGAAAAVVGALGAALVEMTANLTLGRPRLADVQDQAQRIEQRASDLRSQLEHLGDADAEAFDG